MLIFWLWFPIGKQNFRCLSYMTSVRRFLRHTHRVATARRCSTASVHCGDIEFDRCTVHVTLCMLHSQCYTVLGMFTLFSVSLFPPFVRWCSASSRICQHSADTIRPIPFGVQTSVCVSFALAHRWRAGRTMHVFSSFARYFCRESKSICRVFRAFLVFCVCRVFRLTFGTPAKRSSEWFEC